MGSKGRERIAEHLLLGLAGFFLVVSPAHGASDAKQPLAAAIAGLDVSPSAVAAGDPTQARIEIRNLGARPLPSRELLVRLGGGSPILVTAAIPRLRPGRFASLRVEVPVPGSTNPGEHVLRACRAQADDETRCSRARLDTALTVLAPAKLELTPPTHDFGTHATGTTSASQTFTVINIGGVPSGTISTSLSGTDAGQFAKPADNCHGQALAPGASCTLDAVFAPSSVGVKSASLQASASPGGTASASLSGSGAAPANLTISPTSHDFGTQATGTTSASQTFTVINSGGVPSGTISTSLNGTDAGQFAKPADNCDGQVLAAGASCTLDAAFAPSSVGAKSAGIEASASPGGTASASLSGSGAAPANLTISPTSHDFGTHATGTASAPNTFTVTNSGGVPSGTISTSLSGTDAGQFAKPPDGCNGQALAPGASCTLDAVFAPLSVGAKSASLQASASPGGTASASLSGSGAAPANLTISPTSHDFGTHATGEASAPQTFTVTNSGGVPSGTISTSLSGTDAGQFAKSIDGCNGQVLAPGVGCTVDAVFAPSSVGGKSASLQASASPGGTASASLSGNGAAPANLTISPTSHDFGNIQTGTNSPSRAFTVTNSGGVPSGAISTSLNGADAGQFARSADNCDGQALAAGTSCTLSATFSPSSVGGKSASLQAGASPGSTASAPLSGSGAASAANLQVGIRGDTDPHPPPTYSSSVTLDVGDHPVDSELQTRVWIKNVGAADAVISNSPATITRTNTNVLIFTNSSTCNVANDFNGTAVTFTNLVISGGSECYVSFRVTPAATGPFSASFTITGSPGGSITATVAGNAS